MNGIELKNKLKSGRRIYGTAIVSSSTMWASVIKTSALDFVFIDTEHIGLNRETVSNMCNLYSALGFPPIVRIPSPDPYEACTTLDGGAAGILAPYIESVEQVRELIGAVKYRPIKGEKLNQIMDKNININKDSKLMNYIGEKCNNNLLLINIESKPAIDNINELLSISGIDGVIIGPHDLSCSLSIPEEYNNPVFEEQVLIIISECLKRNLGVGIHLSEGPEQQVKWAEKGVNIILHSSDIALFNKMLNHDLSFIQNSLKDDTDSESTKSFII